jgi:hypothetical protein
MSLYGGSTVLLNMHRSVGIASSCTMEEGFPIRHQAQTGYRTRQSEREAEIHSKQYVREIKC